MLKNRIRFGSSLDKKFFKKIQELSKNSRIPVSKLLDEAVELLLIKHNDK